MQNKLDENRRNTMVRNGVELTKERMCDLIDEQRKLISEMKQTQTQAEIAYTNLYRKYAQVIYEKSILQEEVQKVRGELTALANSRSVRITAPLRALKRVLRGWIKW